MRNFILSILVFAASFTTLTAQQTRIVKEGLPGTPANLVECYGLVFFQVHTGTDWDLWKSDGTAAGTKLVKHFSTPSSVFVDFTVYRDELYFLRDHELWRTNSSAVGTVVEKSFAPDLFLWDLTLAGERLYFRATSENGPNELWRSFGYGNTFKVADINRVISPDSDNDDPEFTAIDYHLFFWNTTPSHGTELWTTNGVAAGTRMVKDINPGPADSRWAPGHSHIAAGLDGRVYFAADDGVNGIELWKSDGTEGGTALVKDIAPGSGSSFPVNMVKHRIFGSDDVIFFNASDGVHGEELWKTGADGLGAGMVKDIYPGPIGSYPAQLKVINAVLYFVANDGIHGSELWKSTGSLSSTTLVADVSPGMDNSSINELTGEPGLFFSGGNASTGQELWKINGIVQDILPGEASSSPQFLTLVFGSKLFFAADDGVHGKTLWVYDIVMEHIHEFDLIDAEDDWFLEELHTGNIINLGNTQVNIEADVNSNVPIGSVVFELNGVRFSTENYPPFTLAGENGGDYNAWMPAPGTYEVCATPWSGKNGSGIPGERTCVTVKVINVGLSYTLVNADTDQDILTFKGKPTFNEAVELDLSGIARPERINIRVNTTPSSGGVRIEMGNHEILELTPPYAFFGDNNGNYKAWYDVLPRDMGGTCTGEFDNEGPGHHCQISFMTEAGLYQTFFFIILKYDDIRAESFTLVNALTNTDILQLHEGDVIDLSALPTSKLNIRVNTVPAVVGGMVLKRHIRFGENFDPLNENTPPYAIFGDRNGNYNDQQFVPGEYSIEAVPYSVAQSGSPDLNPKGVCGIPLGISFQVVQRAANKTDADVAGASLQVFPNPNEGVFNVSFTVAETADVKVEVYDLLGKMVYHDELRSFSGAYFRELDLSVFGQGIYMLKVQEGGNATVVKKIIVNGR